MASVADTTPLRRGPEWPGWGRDPEQGRAGWTSRSGERRGGDLLFWLTATLVVAALLLGGASQGNAWQVAAVELISLPVIALALPRLRAQGLLAPLRIPLALIAAMMALPLIQLIPLPMEVWGRLPGRAELAQALTALGPNPEVLPLSLAPHRTLGDFLWLLIPAGVFLGASACSHRQRSMLALGVVAVAVLSQIIAVLQFAGVGEALRFYEVSNDQRPVGLFANRNHNALFLLLALPLLAGWLRERLRRVGFSLLALGALIVPTVATIIVTHSRAGIALGVLAVLGALLVLFRGRGPSGRVVAAGGALFAVVVVAGAFMILNSAGLTNRFAAPLGEDFRRTIWSGTVAVAGDFAPLGAGLGSFVEVYAAAEQPETLQESFVNHAHNDYLEVWLEAGLAGLILALAVLAWLARGALRAWRGGTAGAMARAASVTVALIALHSLVDYPARTPAIAAVLALCCAFLALTPRQKPK